jgi:hypothetical protein
MHEFPRAGVCLSKSTIERGGIGMIRILRAATALVGATAFLAGSAATALAGDGYGGGVKGESAGGSGGLPFTGSDMALYALIAAGLVATGLALRAYSTRRVD